MAKKTARLDEHGHRAFGMRDCLAYAAGDFGCNMSFALKSYMALFWTQVMGLSAWYALLIVILQVWDAINDPLVGSIVDADRRKYKRNKFLQYIWVGSIGLIVGGAMCFLPFPTAPTWAKIIIFMAGYIVWDAFYTVANVPYGSLLSLISSDPADRASLSAWRSIGSIAGNLAPMVILPFLIYNADGSLNGTMVFVAALVMGVIGFILFQLMIRNTEIRVDIDAAVSEDQPKFNLIQSMGNFLRNRPAIGATLAAMGMFIGMQAASTAVSVTFQIYFRNPRISGLISMFAMLPIVIFTPLARKMVTKYGKKELSIVGSICYIVGGSSDDLLENHRILNDLCHEMDKTRLTTVAVVSMCKIDDPYLKISDVVSYNHYFGWYGGDTSMNGPWFDKFHAANPTIPVGCSEYGCEALNWHTSTPMQGDYTEEYQAYYHEELIKQLFTRKYMWATHVWNMFDFGADARNEGGENGQNHKGLVTFDRKYKKDSFYAYKAWLSDEPFVHLCGKRYVDRVEDVTKVTVYSNQPEVELFANGVSLGKKAAADHFFYFDVPNTGTTRLEAVAGDCRDESVIVKVDTPNPAYRFVEKGAVLNWFDIEAPEGYFSLNDKMGDVLGTVRGKMLFMGLMGKMMLGGKKGGEVKKAAGFDITPEMMTMMNGFTVLRLFTLMGGMMDVKFTKEQLLDLNGKLNKIKKP